MKRYFLLIHYNFMQALAFPFDAINNAFGKLLDILFLLLLWYAIMQSGYEQIAFRDMVAYYLLASGINTLVQSRYGRFSRALTNGIKDGTFSWYLLKPINSLIHVYCASFGEFGMNMLFAVLFIIAGIAFSNFSVISVVLFLISFLLAFFIAIAFNIAEGILAIHLTEIFGIRVTINHFIGLLSGLMVPLYFFPDTIRHILEFTPFPYMVFGPIDALQSETLDSEILTSLGIALFWAIILNIVVIGIWKKSLKKYEAIGI